MQEVKLMGLNEWWVVIFRGEKGYFQIVSGDGFIF